MRVSLSVTRCEIVIFAESGIVLAYASSPDQNSICARHCVVLPAQHDHVVCRIRKWAKQSRDYAHYHGLSYERSE